MKRRILASILFWQSSLRWLLPCSLLPPFGTGFADYSFNRLLPHLPPHLDCERYETIGECSGRSLPTPTLVMSWLMFGESTIAYGHTTKIMTALIAIQTADLSQIASIRQDAINDVQAYNGSSANRVVGDHSLAGLLYGLMLPSADDAAIAIADAVGGTTRKLSRPSTCSHVHSISPKHTTSTLMAHIPYASRSTDPNQYTTAG